MIKIEKTKQRRKTMSKILVIAEKPSVAKDIARVLGCKQKGEGFLAGEQYIVS